MTREPGPGWGFCRHGMVVYAARFIMFHPRFTLKISYAWRATDELHLVPEVRRPRPGAGHRAPEPCDQSAIEGEEPALRSRASRRAV